MAGSRLDFMLEQWTLEELFEMMDIEPVEVLRILIEGGHVEPPPFMEGYHGEEA